MNKYQKLIEDLENTGTGTMKCYGNSMLPVLSNPSINIYLKQKNYSIGDIVFCKVRGRYIDAHKITAVSSKRGYLISNNHGHDNGWTHTIYGRVISTTNLSGIEKKF